MARQQPELGTKSPYRIRLGQTIDRFKGVNREADPGAIRDDEFQDAVNIRLTPSGKVVPRGGQSKVNTSAMTGCVEGMLDDEQETIGGMLYAGADDGVQLAFRYNPFLSPTLETVGNGTLGRPLVAFNGRAFFSGISSGGVWTIKSVARDGSIATEFTIPNTLAGFGGSTGVVHDGALYAQTYQVGVASSLYKWDGITASVDDTVAGYTSNAQPISLDGVLYYITDRVGVLGEALVRQRVGATWSTFATIATGSSAFAKLVGYNGTLYAWSGNYPSRLYSINSGGATLATTISDASFQEWAIFDNYLYYLWHDITAERHVIGRFDGATWTNSYELEPFPVDVGDEDASLIVPYDGSLYALVRAGGDLAVIHKSNRSDVTAWSEEETTVYVLNAAGTATVA